MFLKANLTGQTNIYSYTINDGPRNTITVPRGTSGNDEVIITISPYEFIRYNFRLYVNNGGTDYI